jgi:hypothetical protein
VSDIWKWLSQKKTQSTLKFIGSGLVLGGVALWKAFFSSSEPAPSAAMTASAPNGIAIVGSTVSNPVVNNNFATPEPRPHITWSSIPEGPSLNGGLYNPELEKHPGVSVEVVLQSPFRFPLFAIKCDHPCKAIHMTTDGIVQFRSYDSLDPTVTAAGFTTPSDLDEGARVSIDVRSEDEHSIKVLNVQPATRHP